MLLNNLSNDIAADWDDMHRHSPAPRHRRRIILKLLSNIQFNDYLDAGCAQGYLVHEIAQRHKAKGYGCDLSPLVIADNKKRFPKAEFSVVNIESERWVDNRQFDVVISSEVIEHIADWKAAVNHLANMSRKYLLITVPGGVRRPIDIKVGHYRHFNGSEIISELNTLGFSCEPVIRHGFPIHSLYKRLINFASPDKIYTAFSGETKYSPFQKAVSNFLYYLFYLNDLFNGGEQVFIFAKRNGAE